MKHKYPFEKLEVWILSKKLCIEVYRLSDNFPAKEIYGLRAQVTKAAVSVSSNIAEGSSRTSRKDQAHFSQIAYSSLMETVCQLIIAQELGYIGERDYEAIRASIEVISNKLNALRNYQLNS